ncbi:hypothetical protein D187_005933 [Cystobacter fuscus DSM 2262]|uniref:Lipoprotein n=1 Tax=Cystobacter fuscus (strain ATCC 25194 / DSM 2262 / NBRC 100088 / M29) TaxID=1242864 RepID=S9PM39_CYSF2|nr:hypothetical protein [Cystobacter fuscus]EPX63527.1 hypothetical protein D187_005933 [Cystobacter fuscus DSM 2262]
MNHVSRQTKGLKSTPCWLLGAALALGGCQPGPTSSEETTAQLAAPAAAAAEEEGSSTALKTLPLVDAKSATRVFVQQLARPTALEENVAVSVKLPPPANKELSNSLVRVLGDTSNPLVLFRSDTLAQLGMIPKSPGPDFFTSFSQLSVTELERRAKNEQQMASGAFGEISTEAVLFNGRHPVSRALGAAVDVRAFSGGALTPLSVCPARPVSTQASWGKTLLIRDPAVVLDPARTWDPCTGNGTQGGVWTFAHLMRELAQGSGQTPESFVKDWLSLWVNNYTVNGDNVLARTDMFAKVIQPWATASGISSALVVNPSTQRNEVLLGGSLNLDIAPFRLLAIVNRADLGKSSGGGYGGSSDAGELRFVFGVTRPSPWGGGTEASCNLKEFTVIFEYGVPRSGCRQVIDWAQQWVQLGTHASFDASYLSQLETMTESVVRHGMAPSKGNQNALNQIRTNEKDFNPQWELREFTLTTENPSGPDTPVNGGLRPHTVALTPDDATHNSNFDPDVASFVLGTIAPTGVQSPLMVPSQCAASYTVPFSVNGRPFLGGNALVRLPNRWAATGANPASPQEVCARKEFSLNTCNGCHFADTGTTDLNNINNLSFTHISPTSGIPARMSKFLTGGNPGFSFGVPDTQFGASVATWSFADLERRHQRLYDIATCSTCSLRFSLSEGFLGAIREVAGVVPFEPAIATGSQTPFKVGPITNVDLVKRLVELRPQFKSDVRDEPVDFLRPVETFVH